MRYVVAGVKDNHDHSVAYDIGEDMLGKVVANFAKINDEVVVKAMVLTLEEFRKTGAFYGMGRIEGGLVGPGWVYAGDSCHINLDSQTGKCFLVIENQQYSGSKANLEEVLYKEWYLREVVR